MPEISEEDVKLLEALEKEGLLPKNVAKKIRAGLSVANAAGAFRTRLSVGIALIVLACFLCSAAVAAPFTWLAVLCGTLALTALVCGFATVVSTAEL